MKRATPGNAGGHPETAPNQQSAMHQSTPTVFIFMGVCGSGKTTLAQAFAEKHALPYHEGDHYHPEDNVEKMRRGTPLTDEDRAGWLDNLRAEITRHLDAEESAVVTCSALKRSYRRTLRGESGNAVLFVWLHADYRTLDARMKARKNHYMPASLLRSQLESLEPPEDEPGVVALKVTRPVSQLLDELEEQLA